MLCQGSAAGGYSLDQGRQAPLHPQLRRPSALPGFPPPRRSLRAPTTCASSSSRPGPPDMPHGKGAPGRRHQGPYAV